MPSNILFRLVGNYANALGCHGPNSPETDVIRDANADNAEFLAYADALDRIKRNFGGKGMERETAAREIERLTAEVARLRAALASIRAMAEDDIAHFRDRPGSFVHQIEADALAALQGEGR